MWSQILNTVLGLWLMAAPGILNYNGMAANNDHIIGPVVASFAIIALSGCTRAVAKYNIPLGIWLLLAPLVLGYKSEIPTINDMSIGLCVTLFSFFKRNTGQEYGGGWSVVWKSGSSHKSEANGK